MISVPRIIADETLPSGVCKSLTRKAEESGWAAVMEAAVRGASVSNK